MHAWERRLAAVDTNRRVLPFAWGLDWLSLDPTNEPLPQILTWSRDVLANSEEFFTAPSTSDYERSGDLLRFPSAVETTEPVNNTVVARVFPPDPRRVGSRRRAVVVLPQWNSGREGHVGLCRLFARFGMTAVRLTLPYHDERKPHTLERADYIVSPDICRTLMVNRQAVLDARRVVDWLEREGFDHIGIMGTSLGSCLAMLTMSHDRRLQAGAFNHISPYFADVVWRGLSTKHVRAGLETGITLDDLRDCWMPISPFPFIDRVRGRNVLLIYARYDLSFPLDLSRQFIGEFRQRRIPHTEAILPCGHYTTGKAPFKYLDGYALTKFFVKKL
jgi:hypothetical protein